jgi:signal transduction histidine kinase/Flp pilus assembly protein TadD
MVEPLKTYLTAFAIFLSLLFSLPAETAANQLESRLKDSTGKERLEILTELAAGYRETQPPKALQYGKQGLELLKGLPPEETRLYQVHLLVSLGWANMRLTEYESARQYAEQAGKIAAAANDKTGRADAFFIIGDSHRRQGDYTNASDYLNRALPIYTELKHWSGLGYTRDAIGLIYWKQGELTTALEHILEAAKYQEKAANKRGLAEAYNHTGIMYWELGNLEGALNYYLKAGELYKETGDKLGQGKVLNNTAMVYDKQGKPDKALANFKESLRLDEEVGSKGAVSVTLYFLAGHYEQRDLLKEAQASYTRSLALARELHDTEHTAANLVGLSRVERRLGLRRQALEHVREGLELALKIKVKEWISHGYRELSAIHEEFGNYNSALQYHKKYKEFNDSIFSETSSRKMTEMETRFEAAKKEKELILLRNDKQLRDLELNRQKSQKKWLFIVSLLVFILAAVLYARYRLKTRVTLALQKEIQNREQAEDELLKSQKLEAVGILAGGIAHDFNNLLAIIIGNLDMAMDNPLIDPEIGKMLKAAEKSSLQAAELSEKLVTFSRGGWIYPDKLKIATIISDTLARYPELQSQQLDILIPPVLPPVHADERQMRQVLYNLLQNAKDAAGDAGQVTLQAEQMDFKEDNDFGLKQGAYIKLSVSDKGKGIPPEYLNKIFDPYFTTKDDVTRKGMGLGLAICYSIIRKHNGHITVRSEKGAGTTVEVYIPAFNGAN